MTDLVPTRSGYKKTATRYIGHQSRCPACRTEYVPKMVRNFNRRKFGHSFIAWTVYLRIVLRLPYEIIAQVMEDMFNERTALDTLLGFVYYLAQYHAHTESLLVQRILESPFIHIDETRISIKGEDHYVWVFTDGSHVVFRLTKTREASIVHEFLSKYNGIVISDFYGGYDSVKCRQQKCWSHLIGDLNDDLWKEPFNVEFESFVVEVSKLILPILQAAQKYGLRRRHLHKYKASVNRFYDKSIEENDYKSEVTLKYQKRLKRFRDSLFTFLDEDGISWSNNMAERALKPVAVQRKISGSFWEKGASNYLLLLGMAQSCKFQRKPFLKFLMSKEADIDKYVAPKPLCYSQLRPSNAVRGLR